MELYDALSFDNQLIAEKINAMEYRPKQTGNVNTDIQIALLQEELASSKLYISKLKAMHQPTQAPVKCACSAVKNKTLEDDLLDMFSNRKLLIFIVIIMLAVYVMQYMSARNDTRDLIQVILSGTNPKNLPTSQT